MRAILLIGAQVLEEIEIPDPPLRYYRKPIMRALSMLDWETEDLAKPVSYQVLNFECIQRPQLPFCYYICLNPQDWWALQDQPPGLTAIPASAKEF